MQQIIYNYKRKDEDELTFEKGQVILVLLYDDPDYQQMYKIQRTDDNSL